jgi:hypothetical protein
LVSFLDSAGTPAMVERARMLPPRSLVGPIDEATRRRIIEQSIVFGVYEKAVDRESAYEMLKQRAEQSSVAAPEPQTAAAQTGPRKKEPQSVITAVATSAARAMASQAGRSLVRGIMGSLLGSTTTRRRGRSY